MAKLVAYLRVSTDRQAEEGLGLEVQEAKIRAWAKEQGHVIVGWHHDEGVSGSNGLDTRMGLYEAMAAVRDRKARGLVVYRLDRLARDLVLQEQLLAEIRRLKGEAHTTSGAEATYLTDDPDDPSRKLIRQILGAVNEYERSMIALRLRSGRAAKAARGGFAYGSPGYGYMAQDRELVPNDHEQKAVARMQELRDEGGSLRSIAATLTTEGYRPRHGGEWHAQTIRRVLTRL